VAHTVITRAGANGASTPHQEASSMPDQDLRALLPKISCAAIVDAMAGRHAHVAHILDLKSPRPDAVLFGQAVTIRYFPTRKDIQHPIDNNFASLFYRAIEGGGEGKVLVMGGGGHPDSAFGGGRKLSRLRHNGLAGVLAEGRLRDFDALGDYEFATFCRGETVRQGGNLIMPIAAGVPVEIDGVGIIPGDYIYADSSGAVVVPAAEIREVLEEAVESEIRDAASADRMIHEDPATVITQGETR
jgi:4-hydroxy-4-methyl-2-oxoglutarate aldolase